VTCCFVNVAFREHYHELQKRLRLSLLNEGYRGKMFFFDTIPPGCPPHKGGIPYAFKLHAMKQAHEKFHPRVLIWVDAPLFAIRPVQPLIDRIVDEGYFLTSEETEVGPWCADSALRPLGITRELSFLIPMLKAGLVGLDMENETSREFFSEWYRHATREVTFLGPWNNRDGFASEDSRVKGHRHDQTAGSVIAWKLGMKLTNPPDIFSYCPKNADKRTVFVCRGGR